ncbi:DNA polymerase III subunit beta [Heliorestis convoluta]|uniref:Beta sliding clamp n=1 Tax=Heliorestis convoluta TaxID=356322 RepID=A0A5Q2N332_9FIRM|nr:DNA polymerase III subunit beta [Heliorestis convoluta]QGG46985.1 DNA polymerase III, beta subunit [Heliorestis convoluta]
MEFSCTRQELTEGVSAVLRAVSARPPIPILTGIYMEVQESHLRLLATDMELGIEYTIPIRATQTGTTVVNAKIFSEMVRRLPDGPVTFRVDESHLLKVRFFGSELTLHTMNPLEFPVLPHIVEGQQISFTQGQFKEMTRLIGFAASTDESRPWFTGILWDLQVDHIKWIATDTHRLALLQGHYLEGSIQEERQIILSSKTLIDVARLLHDEESAIELTITKSQVLMETAQMRVILRIIEGQYPKYQQVIPKDYKTRITVKVKALLEAVDRAALASIGKEGSNIIKVTMEGNILTIRSNSPEVGHIHEEVFVDMDGESIPIAFNYRYLQEALKVLSVEDIHIDLTGPLVPGVIRPIGEERYLYLIVPVRTV